MCLYYTKSNSFEEAFIYLKRQTTRLREKWLLCQNRSRPVGQRVSNISSTVAFSQCYVRTKAKLSQDLLGANFRFSRPCPPTETLFEWHRRGGGRWKKIFSIHFVAVSKYLSYCQNAISIVAP